MGEPLTESLKNVLDQFGEIDAQNFELTDYEYLKLLLNQIDWDDHNGNDTKDEALASLKRMNDLNELARDLIAKSKFTINTEGF